MPVRKRQAPATPTVPASQRRRSQRISTGSTGKTSRYFESDSEDYGDNRGSKRVKASGKGGRRGGGRRAVDSDDEEDEDIYRSDSSEEEDDDNDGDDEEDDYDDSRNDAKGGNERRGVKRNGKVQVRQDDEDDQDDDGDNSDDSNSGPQVTFIPHKKMRDPGAQAYSDERIHPNTLLFLKDLKANNKRPWLKSNDDEYRRSLQDWNGYIETLTQKIIEADETIPELPVKDVTFRIYRDIRFSKDPTPYKAHYSAAWSRTGRKGPYACYYIHCEPGGCRIGGGLWHPEAQHIQKLRASIDERPRRWRRALMDESFRRIFLPKAKTDEKSVLKAFAEANKGNALKTKPKGFIAEHRDIELLKLRNFVVGKKIPDEYLTAEDGQERVMEIISAMVGFVSHLNNIVMPDPNDSDSDSEAEEDE